MNIRLHNDLRERARACADAVHEPLSEWIRLALKPRNIERAARVVVPAAVLVTTRECSTPVTVPGDLPDMKAREIRERIAKAVIYCELKNPRPYLSDKIEGIDYIKRT